MNNLEPRAKIGDVVIVELGDEIAENVTHQQLVVRNAEIETDRKGKNPAWLYWCSAAEWCDVKPFEDEDILKNLTTNISYE